MSSRKLFYSALLVLAVASAASGARQLQQSYGWTYAEKRAEDLTKRCPGYGNVGRCMPICSFVDDKVVNGFDETITFTVELMEINVTSGDTVFTTCDPVSGDIADYSTGEIITNVQDLPMSKLEKIEASRARNSTCDIYPDASACEPLCDYLVGQDENTVMDMITAYHALLKDFNLVSKQGDYVKCLPDSGLIVDFDSNVRLGNVRDLEKTSHNLGL